MGSDIIIIIAAVVSSGALTGVVTWLTQRNKNDAETDKVAVETAERVVQLVHAQLALMQEEIEANREERRLLIGYIEYIHDRLEAFAINLPTFDEWKEEQNA